MSTENLIEPLSTKSRKVSLIQTKRSYVSVNFRTGNSTTRVRDVFKLKVIEGECEEIIEVPKRTYSALLAWQQAWEG